MFQDISDIEDGSYQSEAFDEFLLGLRDESYNNEKYLQRSFINLKKKRYSEVIKDCTFALMINPHDNKAAWRRGLAYLRIGHPELANRDWEHALDADSENISIQKALTKLRSSYTTCDRSYTTWDLRHPRVATKEQLPALLRKMYPDFIRGFFLWKRAHTACSLCRFRCERQRENLTFCRESLYRTNQRVSEEETKKREPLSDIEQEFIERDRRKSEYMMEKIPEELYSSKYPCPQNIHQFLYMLKVISTPQIYIEIYSMPPARVVRIFGTYGLSLEYLNLFLKSIHYTGLLTRFCSKWCIQARHLIHTLSTLPWFSFLIKYSMSTTVLQIFLHLPKVSEEELHVWGVSSDSSASLEHGSNSDMTFFDCLADLSIGFPA
ncbi:TPR repeat protein [Schizosaccharomyces octosporus yFS286]|uniref:TPR repeat protein n=1 Tax=Schizosaccharomyces octosporus (strain yFS286) TaxID=483514 RepID=S9PT05_SCHOY|nr:TPR repeat protein [Schizosaccharomyces octosporus yFS286]EPX72291.1 TPR repeat protein [Schizosaccharomyces octosporus yFS286]